MNATELHDLFREQVNDQDDENPLWTSEAIYVYLDAAQKEFCRRVGGIGDGRSFTLSLAAGEEWYAFDKRILKIRKAFDMANGREVGLLSAERASEHGLRFDGRPGALRCLVTGIEPHVVRVHPALPEDTTHELALEVYRLPATIGEDDELEIDEQHHLSLLLWVKHLAYSHHDAEARAPVKAMEFRAAFLDYCDTAKGELDRLQHSIRPIAYGGL